MYIRYLLSFIHIYIFSKFIKLANFNILAGQFWPLGHMFDTPVLASLVDFCFLWFSGLWLLMMLYGQEMTSLIPGVTIRFSCTSMFRVCVCEISPGSLVSSDQKHAEMALLISTLNWYVSLNGVFFVYICAALWLAGELSRVFCPLFSMTGQTVVAATLCPTSFDPKLHIVSTDRFWFRLFILINYKYLINNPAFKSVFLRFIFILSIKNFYLDLELHLFLALKIIIIFIYWLLQYFF